MSNLRGVPSARIFLAASLAASCATVPLAVSPAAEPPPARAKTFAFAFDDAAAIRAGFSADWATAARYIDIVASGDDAAAHAAGIRTLMYSDPNKCSGTAGRFADGPNQFAFPDCSALDDGAFYRDGSGRPLTSGNEGRVLQALGDPASTNLREALARGVGERIKREPFDLVEIDDAASPQEFVTGGGICAGAGHFAAGNYACSAPAPAADAFDLDRWRDGERKLAESLPLPVVFNGLQGQTYPKREREAAIASVVVASPNAWGAFCEACFYRDGNPYAVTGDVLDAQLRGALAVVNAGKNVVVMNSSVRDPAHRERGLADTLLVYDYRHVYEAGPACGGSSALHVCPEVALVASDAPYPHALDDLRHGAVYARRFAHCALAGRDVGPCGAVVNPSVDRDAALPPGFDGAHTLRIAGDQLCGAPACAGTAGSAAFDGPPPPARLPPASGYVVTLPT